VINSSTFGKPTETTHNRTLQDEQCESQFTIQEHIDCQVNNIISVTVSMHLASNLLPHYRYLVKFDFSTVQLFLLILAGISNMHDSVIIIIVIFL